MKLYIKYMVSMRCKMIVKSELDKLRLHCVAVDLGEVEIKGNITARQREQLKLELMKSGLVLMADIKDILVEKIKNIILEMIYYQEELPKTNFSDFLCGKLDYGYNYLSGLFSEATGTTIEHYIITHKIERVKELLIYDGLTLSDIAWALNYSSIQHLSTQFKKVTGLTPSSFKSLKQKKRITLKNL